MIGSFFSKVFRPLAYLSIPVILIRGFAMSTPNGRYYVRLGVYVASMTMVATFSAVIGAVMAIAGHRYDVNFVVARTFYFLGSNVLGITIEVEGEEHLNTRPALYMSNHQSMLDILFVARTMPKKASIMAKKSIQISPLGPFMMLAGTIFVDRGNNARAIRSLEAAGEVMRKNRTSLWIYPEGTRHLADHPELLPFKKGGFYLAIQAGIPIVPIVSENYWHLYHQGHFEPGTAKIRVLPPVPTEGLTAADVPELITRVRNQMLEALLEISSHVPAEKKTSSEKAEVEQLSETPSATTSSQEYVQLRDEKTPGPSAPPVSESDSPGAHGVTPRSPSVSSISSSSHGTRTTSENGTETEEDEGMVLVGKPA
ncbi:1-acylglycerol-3-phosphate O-acyltransferase [Marasmius tenuissimus]|uniref:1-acyl-sn-glycerol-3-phosphate acyltransferase n=1 Tax=Marasmius tenuissimus TaxID=585030 RepID=A0ABR3A9Y5_9AGAR